MPNDGFEGGGEPDVPTGEDLNDVFPRWAPPSYATRLGHLWPAEVDPTIPEDIRQEITDRRVGEMLARLGFEPRPPGPQDPVEGIPLEEAVITDLAWSFAGAFEPADVPSPYPPNAAVAGGFEDGPLRWRDITGESVVAVQYHARHVGAFNRVAATGLPVTFEALVVRHPDGSASRYVDWNFVMAQLGMIATGRPMLGDNSTTPDPEVGPIPTAEELAAMNAPDPGDGSGG